MNGHRVKYAKEFTAVYMRRDSKAIFLDKTPYYPEKPLIPRGEDFLVALEDLKKIHSPDLSVSLENGKVHIDYTIYTNQTKQKQIDRQWYLEEGPTHTADMEVGSRIAVIDGRETLLAVSPEEQEGVVYIPYVSMMRAMGALVGSYRGKMVGVSFDSTFVLDNNSTKLFRYCSAVVRGKRYGNVFGCFWFEAGQRIIPYRFYIPTCYNPEKPIKAIFYFHGGGGNEDRLFESTQDYAQQVAEKYGFLLVGTNGFIRSSFYGSLVPIVQTLDSIDPAKVDYNNPEGWPEHTVNLRKLALQCIHEEMQVIFQQVNLDKRNLFATGNSAGSVACMYFAQEDPQLFRAICPTGGFINYNFYDLKKYKELHPDEYMMHQVGTEDDHGFDFLMRGHQKLDELGIRYRKEIVGGGDHSNAWCKPEAIDAMMSFFNEKVEDA